MNENNRPKRPEEILAALSAEGNRIEQLTKEIDEKIYAFYGIQKQFIENGNLITAEHKKVLADLKNYKLPEISLDASAKKQFEEVKEYEKNARKKDRTIPYLIFIIFLLVVTFVYFFNQDLRVKKEVKERKGKTTELSIECQNALMGFASNSDNTRSSILSKNSFMSPFIA